MIKEGCTFRSNGRKCVYKIKWDGSIEKKIKRNVGGQHMENKSDSHPEEREKGFQVVWET